MTPQARVAALRAAVDEHQPGYGHGPEFGRDDTLWLLTIAEAAVAHYASARARGTYPCCEVCRAVRP